MHMEPREAYDNLLKLVELGAYGEGGFYDAVAVKSRTIAKRYLSLDQAMVMGSIGNVFGNGVIRNAFATGQVRKRIRPLIAMETIQRRPGVNRVTSGVRRRATLLWSKACHAWSSPTAVHHRRFHHSKNVEQAAADTGWQADPPGDDRRGLTVGEHVALGHPPRVQQRRPDGAEPLAGRETPG